MKLSVLNRFTIANLLPVKGDHTELFLKQDIIKKTELSEDERELIAFKVIPPVGNQPGTYQWKNESDPMKDISFSQTELAFISKLLVDRDKAKELTQDSLDLYRSFVMVSQPE